MMEIILPTEHIKTVAINRCIYCLNIEGHGECKKLSDEHIIPYGLDGRWILSKASCESCAKITSEFEGRIMKGPMWGFRRLFELPSRKGYPEKYKMKSERGGESIEIPSTAYPGMTIWPILAPPLYIAPGNDRALGILLIKDDTAKARLEAAGAPAKIFLETDLNDYIRLIAKISHCAAVMACGLQGFKPVLNRIILGDDDAEGFNNYVGGHIYQDPPHGNGHEFSINRAKKGSELFVYVKFRLFPETDSPTYFVVAGLPPALPPYPGDWQTITSEPHNPAF